MGTTVGFGLHLESELTDSLQKYLLIILVFESPSDLPFL